MAGSWLVDACGVCYGDGVKDGAAGVAVGAGAGCAVCDHLFTRRAGFAAALRCAGGCVSEGVDDALGVCFVLHGGEGASIFVSFQMKIN
ncbi:MAG: hypothetical protein VW103_04520 [Halieaceae bacterium]